MTNSPNVRVAHQCSPSWWFAHGNVVRFHYSGMEGFWLVDRNANMLFRCFETGEAGLTVKTRPIPDHVDGSWLWKNVNEGQHPAVDRFNEAEREAYKQFPDEMREARDKAKAEQEAEKRAKWKAKEAKATPLELGMMHFDWSFEYADRFDSVKWEKRKSIFTELESMNYDDAIKSWDEYGPYLHDNDDCVYGMPNWSKCPR